jgi:hypothetical protein
MASRATGTRATDTSPHAYARAAGMLFLVLLVLGPFSILFVPSQIIEAGDAAATAANVADSENLLRAAILSDTVIFLTEIAMAVVLYLLFRPVSPALSAISALARFGQAVVMAVNVLVYFVILLLLSGATYLAAVETEQREALALMFFEVHDYGVLIGQAFFGFSLLLLGYLIHRSAYVPRVLGVLMVVAAAGYLVDSLGNFVNPDAEETLSALVGVTSVIGELPFFLWLLIKGVNLPHPPAAVRTPHPASMPTGPGRDQPPEIPPQARRTSTPEEHG